MCPTNLKKNQSKVVPRLDLLISVFGSCCFQNTAKLSWGSSTWLKSISVLIFFSLGINSKSWFQVPVCEFLCYKSYLSNSFRLYHWHSVIFQEKCRERLQITFLVFESEICPQNLLKYLKLQQKSMFYIFTSRLHLIWLAHYGERF